MKKIPTHLLAAAVTIGSALWISAAPAEAQGLRNAEQQRRQDERRRQRDEGPAQQQGRVATAAGQQLTAEETAAIRPVLEAVQAQDWATAGAGLPAAKAAAQSPYGRYVVGQLQFEIGRNTQNSAMQSEAVDAMLASGAAPEENIRPLLNNQVAFAIRAQNYAAAEGPLARLVELDPNDTERLTQLAEVKIHLNKRPEALALYRRISQIHEGAGQPVPENVRQRVLALAADAGQTGEALTIARDLLESNPSPENWRNAIILYRQTARPQGDLAYDLRRFMRAAGLLSEEADYLALADEAIRAGLPGEAKAALEEGLARNALRSSDSDVRTLMNVADGAIAEDRRSLPGFRTRALAGDNGRQAMRTGDAYFGYGQYSEAAELYRAALQKSGADANMVNLRLGAALALAGQRSEAEAALRAVTGPRQDIARFWLIWLANRG